MMAVRLTQHVNLKIQSELETYSGQLGHWRSKAGASPPPEPYARCTSAQTRISNLVARPGTSRELQVQHHLSEQLLTDEGSLT